MGSADASHPSTANGLVDLSLRGAFPIPAHSGCHAFSEPLDSAFVSEFTDGLPGSSESGICGNVDADGWATA